MIKPSSTHNILISACLLGSPVRYNGTDLLIDHPLLKEWQLQGRLFSICPEVAGGLSTPRAAAEITRNKTLKVIDCNHQDVTQAFVLGAQKTLEYATKKGCSVAIMSENSPSCGSSMIYDGSFSGTKIVGAGITTTLLEKNNIHVFNQYQLDDLQAFLV